ncbi:rhomboid-like protein [Streptomyces sp. NPDC088350]|uniref:rhomboid-like protein n=1 Tax=Streptomyces sp. NPDC088350 TaxID=3365854 RepID=UPI0037FBCABF
MERTATAGTKASATPSGTPSAELSGLDPDLDSDLDSGLDAGLLEAMPRQREVAATAGELALALRAPAAVSVSASTPAVPGESWLLLALRSLHPWRLLPTPTGTPFTFAYAMLLLVTSLVAQYADATLVNELHQASSTDVAHLVRDPLLVLVASALWIVGGMMSPYAILFLLVLTALERRIGGMRAAAVFVSGHILATLATEGTVGIAVLAGHLPNSSLHRLDYGISFGVATSIGALSGLLRPWLGLPLIGLFGWSLVEDLIEFTDPMTNWGHLISLTIGVATWPLIRRWHRAARVTRLEAARFEAARFEVAPVEVARV